MSLQRRPRSTYPNFPASITWLRWGLLAAVLAVLILSDPDSVREAGAQREQIMVVAGAGVGGGLVLGLLAYTRLLGGTPLALIGVLFDSVLAAGLYWAFDGAVAPLLVFGAFAVVTAVYRFGWWGVVGALIPVAALTALAVVALDDPAAVDRMPLAASGLSLLAFGALCAAALAGPEQRRARGADSRDDEVLRLRAARERAQAIYEMANTLGTTLDYRHVMEAAQDIGTLGLREISNSSESRLISAVLLFQGEDNKLRLVTSRRLTRADEHVVLEGTSGVLGMALKQAEPVFAGDATHDPELRYFAGFQQAQSVLAIPLRAGYDNYGVLVFGSDQPNAFSDEHIELLTAIGTQSTIALQRAVLYQNLLAEKEKIVEVEEDARKKLARDLHDGPTQSVAAIAMRVNYIRRLLERQPQQAIEELWKVEELARRTTKEIRHMLFTLRPLVLETQGLIAALHQLAEKMRETHNTTMRVEANAAIEDYLDHNAQGVLFYIVEEAVNNARKHAQASQIMVRLYQNDAFVVVEIADDGVGFDVAAVDSSYDRRGSLGMVNMRERAELIEGRLHVESAPGKGTTISVLLPFTLGEMPGMPAGSMADAPLLTLQSQHHSPPVEPAASSAPEPPPARPPQESPPPTPRIRRLPSLERRSRPPDES